MTNSYRTSHYFVKRRSYRSLDCTNQEHKRETNKITV